MLTLTLRGHTETVGSLVLSSDGKRLSSADRAMIKVWDLEAGKETLTSTGHTNEVRSLALSSDGKRLFSGRGEFKSGEFKKQPGEIKVWDAEVQK